MILILAKNTQHVIAQSAENGSLSILSPVSLIWMNLMYLLGPNITTNLKMEIL